MTEAEWPPVAEATLLTRGIHQARLARAIGLDCTERFYEKDVLERAGNTLLDLPTPDGSVFKPEVWRYGKSVR